LPGLLLSPEVQHDAGEQPADHLRLPAVRTTFECLGRFADLTAASLQPGLQLRDALVDRPHPCLPHVEFPLQLATLLPGRLELPITVGSRLQRQPAVVLLLQAGDLLAGQLNLPVLENDEQIPGLVRREHPLGHPLDLAGQLRVADRSVCFGRLGEQPAELSAGLPGREHGVELGEVLVHGTPDGLKHLYLRPEQFVDHSVQPIDRNAVARFHFRFTQVALD
jgi:hypothetical protein